MKVDPKKILQWTGHLLIIGSLVIPVFFQRTDPKSSLLLGVNALPSQLLLILIYFANLNWFIPKFINNRKYKGYFVSILISLIAVLILMAISKYYLADYLPQNELPFVRDLRDFVSKADFKNQQKDLILFIPEILRFSVAIGLGTTLSLILLLDAERKRNDEIEKLKSITELNLLKSQLNPHFLLNSLNNIYSLARKKSEDTTEAILLLSNLLRHILYDGNKSRISLHDEISFIRNFVHLEKLKFNEENMPNINFTVSIKNGDYPIVPLLMMTLVENAFKHGVSYINPSFILISLEENDLEIKFSVINSWHQKKKPSLIPYQHGLGIKNLEEQLKLSYPGKYRFSQKIENKLFKTFLTIKK